MKVLLGGGTGFIGSYLHSELVNLGHIVQVISRTTGDGRVTWEELRKTRTLPECDVVVNLAGENIGQVSRNWDDSYKKDMYDSRIGTNDLLVELIKGAKQKPSTWITAHSPAIYPLNNDEEYDDNFVFQGDPGDNFIQRMSIDWEKSGILTEDLNVRHVGIRIGLVLGKDGGFVQKAWWPFKFGFGATIGSGTQYVNWIHVKDCVNLFVYAIDNENVRGMLNGISSGNCRASELTKAFGKALHRPTFLWIPEFLVKYKVGSDRAPYMLQAPLIKPTRTLEFGFQFEFTDIEKAFEDIVNSTTSG